ncbi:MAG TPA: hypothetical protein VGN81_24785 [Pseudonocardiaceae bacterium]|jgi:hypothetical protein
MTAVLIEFDEADVDDQGHDLLGRLLRAELQALEVDDVRLPVAATVPAGAKGTAAATGQLIVSLANSAAFGAVLTSLVQVLRAWIARGQGRRVILKDGDRSLELTGASTDQQQQAVDAFARSMTAPTIAPASTTTAGHITARE